MQLKLLAPLPLAPTFRRRHDPFRPGDGGVAAPSGFGAATPGAQWFWELWSRDALVAGSTSGL
jgi:hypothetical protein